MKLAYHQMVADHDEGSDTYDEYLGIVHDAVYELAAAIKEFNGDNRDATYDVMLELLRRGMMDPDEIIKEYGP